MSEPNANGGGPLLEVDTALAKVRAKGYRMGDILHAASCAILSFACLLLWDIRVDTRANMQVITAETTRMSAAISTAAKMEHDRIAAAIDKATEAQQESNYLLSIPAAERERLNIRMPESLRRRVY